MKSPVYAATFGGKNGGIQVGLFGGIHEIIDMNVLYKWQCSLQMWMLTMIPQCTPQQERLEPAGLDQEIASRPRGKEPLLAVGCSERQCTSLGAGLLVRHRAQQRGQ